MQEYCEIKYVYFCMTLFFASLQSENVCTFSLYFNKMLKRNYIMDLFRILFQNIYVWSASVNNFSFIEINRVTLTNYANVIMCFLILKSVT